MNPIFKRTPAASISTLPGSLPVAHVADDVDAAAVAAPFMMRLESLNADDMTHDALWRDSLALTGTFRTFYSAAVIQAAWKDRASRNHPVGFTLNPHSARIARHGPKTSWVEASFVFETQGPLPTKCSGFLSLVPDGKGVWKIWVLCTILEQLKGYGNPDVLTPRAEVATGTSNGVIGYVGSAAEMANGAANGVNRHPKPAADTTSGPSSGVNGYAVNGTSHGTANGVASVNGHTKPAADTTNGHSRGVNGHEVNGTSHGTANGINGHAEPKHFDCVVVGAGQAGLSTAGRLKAMGVSCVVLDRNSRVGDNWMLRYDSVKLHTVRQFAHLPGETTFGPEWPMFLTKKDLATGYQRYVDRFELDVWLSTGLEIANWSEEKKTWTLRVRRHGEKKIITCRHIVFAVGQTSPTMPNYPNRENFKGTILHSVEYKNPLKWKGKAGIVIGTANTAHDVAEDMLNAGLSSVTMVQRGRTYVLPVQFQSRVMGALYNDHTPTELADRLAMSNPTNVTRLMALNGLTNMARQEPERFDALERAGFKTDRFGDIYRHLYERFGGHYMDVGASAKIAQGLIKMKSDATPIGYTSNGLEFSDGTEIPADLIVFTTGFVNMRKEIAPIVGEEIAEQLEEFWGVDQEGEILGAFKPSGHPGLWYMGGSVGQARYMSRFVALQVQADVLGTPLEIYRATPSGN
ncbi:MAG: dimethylaniline monooxygenase (N-oxide forming) [Lasallia pustulata]|uniref:Dimethylaniline monooxygenase (N-oxide forming) n=1 Tax=Lasallia pustulata TaxID=136370 RepID=A0A5M8PHN2_9LECA|nr:MAG: dimethylaniline monooxygenase (N-oxide forming) [Lasallia pustulata]